MNCAASRSDVWTSTSWHRSDRSPAESTISSQHANAVPKDTQLNIWRSIAGSWEDDRSTDRIIADIYGQRTPGREVSL